MSQVEEIKERLNIIDVVSGYVKLEKAGRNYKGLSPFTKEKTPSFFVSPDKGMYYCFSTNKGGDIFTFVEEMEGVDFLGALHVLADRAGVKLRREEVKDRGEHERLYDLLEKATYFYQKNFAGDKNAFRYMIDRGIKTEVLKEFRVGYAKDSWDGLLKDLKESGIREEEMEKAGLLVRRDGEVGHYDRFRSRIMFPITDTASRVVGFTGRIFGKEGKETGGKYVNTPETLLYHKSRLLYGFDRAKDAIREKNSCILVEGQMDVLASHQAGVKNAVAVSGTSLTVPHLRLILRFTNELVLSLDADAAGLRAADRSAKMALALGMNVSAIAISGGKDPADLVKTDPFLWQEAVSRAEEYIDFRIKKIGAEEESDPASVMKETIFPHIYAIAGSIKKDRALQKIAKATDASLEAIRDEYESWARSYHPEEDRNAQEEELLPERTEQFFSGTSRKDVLSRRIFGVIFWQEAQTDPLFDMSAFKSGYFDLVEESEASIMEKLDEEEKKKLSFEAEILYGDSEDPKNEAQELLKLFEVEILNEKLETLLREMRKKQNNGESENDAEELQKEYHALSRKKEELKQSLPH